MKYLIIGGVAGGATVAARLRRMDEKAEIILFERGKYVSYANCGLPYYIGDTINDRNKLFVQTLHGSIPHRYPYGAGSDPNPSRIQASGGEETRHRRNLHGDLR